MRGVTLWRKLLGVEQVHVLDVTLQDEAGRQVLVISVRPTKGARGRCGRRCPQLIEVEPVRRRVRHLMGGRYHPQAVLRIRFGGPVPATPRRDVLDCLLDPVV